jgi:hypothetical protein
VKYRAAKKTEVQIDNKNNKKINVTFITNSDTGSCIIKDFIAVGNFHKKYNVGKILFLPSKS